MARQEEGWPLGLQPLNVRVGLARNNHFSGSISFNATTLTCSPSSSSDSSSDLDTESTGSFFHDKSTTLGSLIGVSSIVELSRRSIRGRKAESSKEKKNTNTTTTTSNKSKFWLLSLCSRDSTDAEIADMNNPPSLGHFLAVERRAANECGRNHTSSPIIFGPDELALTLPATEPNSLFINGCVAPPQSSSCHAPDSESRKKNTTGMENSKEPNSYGVSILFSCMCAQASL
ncbi:hypothetical protein SLEP1_g19805 [Rubroshorea leprosula]|uniref:Uncharacterized protein n=1 Tax=Rubroshorea leprosula TaxID=152421 RepID=A0AAV5J9J8_9ROSI|nr:hypothetical protein SLEP1_g19805 [Rubroshorea leprosula]